jgi:hypothetical protein
LWTHVKPRSRFVRRQLIHATSLSLSKQLWHVTVLSR